MVNVKCSNCGKEVTGLPFVPDGRRPVYCRECYAKHRQSSPMYDSGQIRQSSYGWTNPRREVEQKTW